MLLTLVCAINYNGRPLFSATMDGDPRPYVAPLEEEGQPRNRLLNALTALLVRNHEIITTVMNSSYEQVLALQQSNNSEQQGDPDSGTEDESDRPNANAAASGHAENLSSATSLSASFTTLANPCDRDTYVSSTNYTLMTKGTSHRIHFRKWDKLLQI